MKYGNDVSHHNGLLDMSKYKYDFIIIRGGYGKSVKQIDKCFLNTVKQCISLKIPYGIYWYSYAKTPTEAIEEAVTMHEIIKQYATPDTPLFYDIEEKDQLSKSGTELSTIATAFFKTLENYGYKKIGIYTSDGYISKFDDLNSKYIRWVARIGSEPKHKYDIFQYTWTDRPEIGVGDFDKSKCSDDVYLNVFTHSDINNIYDVDGDGVVTAHDSLKILQHIVGLNGGERYDSE